MAVGVFFYYEPVSSERALRARDVNALAHCTRTIDLHSELVRRRVRAGNESVFDVLQRDRGSTTAACCLRRNVTELALQPYPPLHRGFPDPEQYRELAVGAFARLVGGDNTFTKCDWMTVNHHPDQIRNGSATQDPRIKSCEHWG